MTLHKHLIILLTILLLMAQQGYAEPIDHVTIAILAKDKAHVLPLYLSCIENQTWPKEKTYLYIRTNNNNDDTASILQEWVKKVGSSYAGVYLDSSDVAEQVQQYKQHEWNLVRFKVLGKVRQDSIDWAHKHDSHYFVVDCDNFIKPHTLEKLVQTDLPIVAPLLTTAEPNLYSNYHAAIDANGYYAYSTAYIPILKREVHGLIQMPVVHSAYFIRHDVLDQIAYDDGSERYGYVIFSDNARKKQIAQYLDNREVYGRISFAEDVETFQKEPWLYEFADRKEQLEAAFTQIYDKAIWARNDQGKGSSGEGSTADTTFLYRCFLKNFFKENDIHSVVDGGCGDWEFSRLIDWQGINYTGYDVVKTVIDSDAQYASPTIQFVHANFSTTDLPSADLFICKDVLQHLPNDVILALIPQLKKFKYCLIINDTAVRSQAGNQSNVDTIGGYRLLDLSQPPFNLAGERLGLFDSGLTKKEIFLIKNP